MIRFILINILVFIKLNAVYAQNQTQKLPVAEDFFMDFAPQGFVHMHEQQNINQVLIEYLPEGEKLENWTQMLSIYGTPIAEKVPDLRRHTDLVFSGFNRSCQTLDLEPIQEDLNTIILKVSCLVKKGVDIPGGKGLKWENGVYRFVKTKKMIYQIHFVTHGRDMINQEENSAYMDQAVDAVNQVLICTLNNDELCPPVDVYLSEDSTPLKLEGLPPCYEQGYDCNPSALFEVKTSNSIKIDDTKKDIFLSVDFSKEDLMDPNVLRKYLNILGGNLRKGAPGAVFILRGSDKNAKITNEERVKAGSFISYMRMFLVAQKIIDPNQTKVVFMNFKS